MNQGKQAFTTGRSSTNDQRWRAALYGEKGVCVAMAASIFAPSRMLSGRRESGACPSRVPWPLP
jgi:hypothetical protein